MVIKVQKSHYMLLSSRDPVNDLWLCIGNEKLDQQRPTKLLGFIMNASLSWQDRIDAIYKNDNVQRNVYLLRHFPYFLDRTSARTFYFQFIYCHGQAIMPWTDCFCYKNGLFVGLHMCIPTEFLIQSLRLFPLPKLVCYFPYLFAQKVYNFLSPPFIYRRFKIYNRFSLRDKHILAYPTD